MDNKTMKALIAIVIIIAIAGVGYLIWDATQDDENQGAEVVTNIMAFNQTKNADATTVPASPKDIVVYTLTVENKSSEVAAGYVVEANISDISELATLIDAQGANYNSTNNSLVWTPLDVPANGSFDKRFSVRIKDSIPANSDAVMVVKFNNEVAVRVNRDVAVAPTPVPTPTPNPTPAPVPPPAPAYQAPTTGPSELLSIVLAVILTLGLVLARNFRRTSAQA